MDARGVGKNEFSSGGSKCWSKAKTNVMAYISQHSARYKMVSCWDTWLAMNKKRQRHKLTFAAGIWISGKLISLGVVRHLCAQRKCGVTALVLAMFFSMSHWDMLIYFMQVAGVSALTLWCEDLLQICSAVLGEKLLIWGRSCTNSVGWFYNQKGSFFAIWGVRFCMTSSFRSLCQSRNKREQPFTTQPGLKLTTQWSKNCLCVWKPSCLKCFLLHY